MPYDKLGFANDVPPALNGPNLATMEDALAQAYNFYSVTDPDYGAVGNDIADDKTAIDAALTAAAASKGVVWFPPGKTYKTSGGHVIPPGVKVLGHGPECTVIDHTGDNVCFTYEDTSAGLASLRPRIEGLWIKGNSGSSAVGIEVRGSYGFSIERVVVGNNAGSPGRYTNGVALLVHNYTTNTWVEGLTLNDFHSWYNKTGIRLKRTNGTNSFAYGKWNNFSINVPISGIGIHLAAAGEAVGQQLYVYSNEWHGNIWLDNIGGTGAEIVAAIQIDPGGQLEKSYVCIKGEVLNPGTAVSADNRFRFTGAPTSATSCMLNGSFIFEGGGTATDVYAGSAVFRVTGIPVPRAVPGRASIIPVAHAAHAGIGFSSDSNEETAYLWGYGGGGAGHPVAGLAKKPFAGNPTAAWDAGGNLVFWADADGSVHLGTYAASVKISKGAGSPNTVVTGNPGDLYINTSGGAATTLYVKETGTGTNTGWVAK